MDLNTMKQLHKILGLVVLMATTLSITTHAIDNVIATHKLPNGVTRTFYVKVTADSCKQVFVHDEGRDRRIPFVYDRYGDDENFVENGFPFGMWYTVHPATKSLFLVSNMQACSSGFLTEYQLYKVDMNTLDVVFVTDCAGVAKTEDGFSVVQGLITNLGTAHYAYQYKYRFYTDLYDWGGRIVKKNYQSFKTFDEWMPWGFEEFRAK